MACAEIAVETLELTVGAAMHPTRVAGPVDGPLVLCLHGFPDVPQTFDRLLSTLADAGYRAAAPTMRGYAPSCQPQDGDYRVAAIAEDVLGFIDALGAERAHVFGHDWGAVVAYAAAARWPERLRSLTTLAVPPAGGFDRAVRRVPRQLVNSWYQLFFQIPVLSDVMLSARDWALVRWLCRVWSPGLELSGEAWAMRRAMFERPGVRRAMLRWYRHNLRPWQLWRRQGIFARQTIAVPSLLLSGADDGCIDTRLYDHLVAADDFPAEVRVQRLEGLGHFAHLEDPARIEALLLPWLARYSRS